MSLVFQFDKTNRTYDNGTRALQDFSAIANEGERISFIGPSGCGKSTILRLLSGLDEADNPASFELSNKGEVPVGYVFQDATLLPWHSVWENIYMPMRLKGISRDSAKPKIDALLEAVELEEFADALPAELSGGMKMRVSIARALVLNPSLLLLDEPFAALDEMTRFKLNELLLDLHRLHNFTLVLVTHSVFEAVYLTERIAIVSPRPGRIVREISAPRGQHVNDGSYRTTKKYQAVCADVSASLQASLA